MELKVSEQEGALLFEMVRDFELSHTFECGQCFRWNQDIDGSYIGVAAGRAVRLIKDDERLFIKGSNALDADFWIDYLDLKRDYGKIKESYVQDPIMAEAVQYGYGMRILNQQQFETIISFIISANNRMSRIKGTVESISKGFGQPIEFEGRQYFSFPTPEQLSKATAEDLRNCGCGFRAEYIVDTAKKIATGGFVIAETMAKPLEEAHKDLIELSGIGPKVADCILLFSMKKTGAFPVDVWVKRVMQHFYTAPDMSLKKIREYGMDKFGQSAGIAQQYLFYYAREKKIGA